MSTVIGVDSTDEKYQDPIPFEKGTKVLDLEVSSVQLLNHGDAEDPNFMIKVFTRSEEFEDRRLDPIILNPITEDQEDWQKKRNGQEARRFMDAFGISDDDYNEAVADAVDAVLNGEDPGEVFEVWVGSTTEVITSTKKDNRGEPPEFPLRSVVGRYLVNKRAAASDKATSTKKSKK